MIVIIIRNAIMAMYIACERPIYLEMVYAGVPLLGGVQVSIEYN